MKRFTTDLSALVHERIQREMALAKADMLRERRLDQLGHAMDNLFFETALAELLNREAGDYIPPLAELILKDKLPKAARVRLALLSNKFPVRSDEYSELIEHFENLGREVL